MLKRFQCALILSHHTNKPPREPVAWNSATQAYAGAGSAEWANFARAILALSHTTKEGTFKLCAVKRGKRLGWKLPDGKTPTTERFLKHSSKEGQIYWEETTEKFVVNRPKPPPDIMAFVPTDRPIAKSSLIANARGAGIGEKTTRNLIDAALANEDLFLHRKPREGTNPEPWISRLRETPEGFLPPSKAIESKTLATDAGTSETPPPECQSPN